MTDSYLRAYPVLGIETEADRTLANMPLAVRMKLDLAGCKISLDQWRTLDQKQRKALFAMSAETGAEIDAFRAALAHALNDAGCPPPADLPVTVGEWQEPGPLPPDVEGVLIRAHSVLDWAALDRFGRYVICKLARKHDDERLRKAVAELAGRRVG